MNSTLCAVSTAQKRSSGLCSRGSSNLLHPQRGPPCALRAARPLRRREPHVGTDQGEVYTTLVVLTRRPERSGCGGIAAAARHRRHFTPSDGPGGLRARAILAPETTGGQRTL